MAKTTIADIIVPDVFNPYVVERSIELTNFYMGGIVSNDDQLNALAGASGGGSINMPFWTDLDGDDEVLSDSGALTPANISAKQDKAVLLMRGKAWSVNDLAKALSGEDPMMAIGDLVAQYWARRKQIIALQMLVGVFADNLANDGADMIVDVSGATNADVTADTKFGADAFVDGQATFGDASRGLAGVGMHSTVYHNLKKTDAISFEKESLGDLEIETYRGLALVVNDGLPVVAAGGAGATDTAPKFTTYLFGTGALGYGQGSAPVPSETDRDSLAGDDVLITRDHFILHPRGVKFTDTTVAGASPTNTELALAANWDRVYNRKHVRVAKIITNG